MSACPFRAKSDWLQLPAHHHPMATRMSFALESQLSCFCRPTPVNQTAGPDKVRPVMPLQHVSQCQKILSPAVEDSKDLLRANNCHLHSAAC